MKLDEIKTIKEGKKECFSQEKYNMSESRPLNDLILQETLHVSFLPPKGFFSRLVCACKSVCVFLSAQVKQQFFPFLVVGLGYKFVSIFLFPLLFPSARDIGGEKNIREV